MKKGIVLCSGGLDSVTAAHYVKKKLGYEKLIILFFNYGQKSLKNERKHSKNCAKSLESEFIEIKLPGLSNISPSLINKPGEANKLDKEDLKDTREEGKNWYVPFRNTIFLSYAISLAESRYLEGKGKFDLLTGFKREDAGGFPDTSDEFVKAVEKLGKFSNIGNIKISAPLSKKDKPGLINIGGKLGVDFKKTHSCYIGKKTHCGYCLACRLRQEGFYWANIKDPTIYDKRMKDSRLAE